MVSVSGIDVKFGRIAAFIVVVVLLIVLYKNYGSGGTKSESGYGVDNLSSQVAKSSAAEANQLSNRDNQDSKHQKVSNDAAVQESDFASKHSGGSQAIMAGSDGLKSLTVNIDNNKCELTYIRKELTASALKKEKIILLHGMRFNASTWDSLGTLSKLRDWGYDAVALNAPTTKVEQCTGNHAQGAVALMHNIVTKLGFDSRVVVVSPSASGGLSIPYMFDQNYRNEIVGYVPIAPVIPKAYQDEERYATLTMNTLIVYGENDAGLGVGDLKYLEKIPKHKTVKIEGAGHACYIDKPDRWHDELKAFLESLSSTETS